MTTIKEEFSVPPEWIANPDMAEVLTIEEAQAQLDMYAPEGIALIGYVRDRDNFRWAVERAIRAEERADAPTALERVYIYELGVAEERERATQREAEVAAQLEELGELRALFEMQHQRDTEAVARWRAEAPEERALTLPDYGKLLDWLWAERNRAALDVAMLIREITKSGRCALCWHEQGEAHLPECLVAPFLTEEAHG